MADAAICLKVSLGEPFLGFPTKQGEVLYLCLEDNYNRLQNRLFEITDIAHRNLKLAIKANDITNGLVYQIQDFMADYPNTKLIVIDTKPTSMTYSDVDESTQQVILANRKEVDKHAGSTF